MSEKNQDEASMNERKDPLSQESRGSGDELQGLLQLVLMVWGRKKWVVLGTLVVTLLGVTVALLSKPVYVAQATIAMKERDQSSTTSRLFSQLPGGGGLVNSNLEKTAILLKGYELAETVIRTHDLMPELFPSDWDWEHKAWKSGHKVPSLSFGILVLKETRISVIVDSRKGVITLAAKAGDSLLVKRLVDYYLAALNDKIRLDIMKDADVERQYLESQRNGVIDPVLQEKIQNMIAYQIEKSMLASSQAFQVLEPPVVPQERLSPKRKKIVVMFFITGFFLSCMGVLAWNRVARVRAALIQKRRPGTGNAA